MGASAPVSGVKIGSGALLACAQAGRSSSTPSAASARPVLSRGEREKSACGKRARVPYEPPLERMENSEKEEEAESKA